MYYMCRNTCIIYVHILHDCITCVDVYYTCICYTCNIVVFLQCNTPKTPHMYYRCSTNGHVNIKTHKITFKTTPKFTPYYPKRHNEPIRSQATSNSVHMTITMVTSVLVGKETGHSIRAPPS